MTTSHHCFSNIPVILVPLSPAFVYDCYVIIYRAVLLDCPGWHRLSCSCLLTEPRLGGIVFSTSSRPLKKGDWSQISGYSTYNSWISAIISSVVGDIMVKSTEHMTELASYSCGKLKTYAFSCVTCKRKNNHIPAQRDASDKALANDMKQFLELDMRSVDSWLTFIRGNYTPAVERIRVVSMLVVNRCNAFIPLAASIALLCIFRCDNESELGQFHSWCENGADKRIALRVVGLNLTTQQEVMETFLSRMREAKEAGIDIMMRDCAQCLDVNNYIAYRVPCTHEQSLKRANDGRARSATAKSSSLTSQGSAEQPSSLP